MLTGSNHGRGAHATVDISDQDDTNTLTIAGNGNTLDNFFIHFGVRLINGLVLPSPKALSGLRSLVGDGLAAFSKDLQRRQAISGSPSCQGHDMAS